MYSIHTYFPSNRHSQSEDISSSSWLAAVAGEGVGFLLTGGGGALRLGARVSVPDPIGLTGVGLLTGEGLLAAGGGLGRMAGIGRLQGEKKERESLESGSICNIN